MANLLATVPGITPFERQQLVTDVRFNTMVSEIATKISEDGGKQLVGNLADLTTTNKSNVVAAINENTLAIGQLSNTRGYSNIPIISTDILLKNTNGWCRGINIPNAPIQNTWVFYRTVITGDSFPWEYGFVRAYDYENKKEFVNFRGTSGWQGWREMAITDKVIPYNPTPQPNLDANTVLTTSIITTASYCTNLPALSGLPASTEGVLTTTRYNAQFIMQTFRSIYPEQPTFTRTLYQGVWRPWGVQKQEIYIPYNAGYADNDTSRYNSKLVQNGFDQVIAYGSVKKSDGSSFAAGVDVQVAILPAGWKNRFNNQIGAAASSLDGGYMGPARATIFDGTIFVRTTITCPCIMFTIPYELYRV